MTGARKRRKKEEEEQEETGCSLCYAVFGGCLALRCFKAEAKVGVGDNVALES